MEEKTFLMGLKDLLTKRVKEKETQEETKVELATMKTEDGAMLEADAFESGNSVFIVNEEERVPLPVGEYILDDGMLLKVEEEGVIASMGEKPAEEETEASLEFATVEQVQQLYNQFNLELEELKNLISKELLSKEEKIEELSKEVELKDEKLKEPAAEPLKTAPVEKEVKVALTKKGRILDTISNLKNN